MKDKTEEIIKQYEKYTGKTPKNYLSPGAPSTTLHNNSGEKSTWGNADHWFGKVMFYSPKISPECAFTNIKLASHMHNPGLEHWKAMDRIIGYIKGNQKHELIIKKPR